VAAQSLFDQPRIVVVGTGAAGKITFSRELARLLGRPHIELDALFWGPKWVPNPRFRECVASAVNEQAWVVDGNYRRIRDVLWRRATALVWLNLSLPVVMYRVLARTVRRLATREEFLAGNRESLRMALSRDGIL
jgi:adenylate kinase family enzyme